MSRTAGSKRKAMSVQSEENETESITTDIDENINAAIDKEIEKEIAEIKAGRHPNLLQATESLEHAKEKKIHAADRHRKMQIKNINALYEYEVEDANALYKKAYSELQDELILDLQSERNRQLLASAAQEKSGNRKKGGKGSAKDRGRTLRSTAPGSAESTQDSSNGGSANAYSREYQYSSSRGGIAAGGSTGNGASTNSAAAGSSSSSRKRASVTAGLDYQLSEAAMRADFVDIVRDLQTRAAAFDRTKSKAPEREVRISGDLAEIYVGDEAFAPGDLVVVFSVLSQENVSGIVTALTHRDLVVRTPTGSRFRVLVGQLRTGRVVLSKDRETVQNAAIFKTAADMQAAKDKFYSS